MIVCNGAAGEMHQVETMIGGVGILDYDGDGWPDIYVANGAEVPNLSKTGQGFSIAFFTTIMTEFSAMSPKRRAWRWR